MNKDHLIHSPLQTVNIRTSFIQRLLFNQKNYRNYLPFYPLAIEQFDLREYNIILSSSFAVAKGVMTGEKQLHICYMHTPLRAVWDFKPETLSKNTTTKILTRPIIKLLLHFLKIWDMNTTHRVTYFIANSNYTATRIKSIYNRNATVIYPPVDIDTFKLEKTKGEFYVTVSRLVFHKNIDIIVAAFLKMPDKRLFIIGEGPDFSKLKKQIGPNIELLGFIPKEQVINYLQKAKAFIFAAEEDFGIAPIEAMACGTPVIAYGKGGVLETVISNQTGIFFNELNYKCLCQSIYLFESLSKKFDPALIRTHAENFSKIRFEKEFKMFVEARIRDFFG